LSLILSLIMSNNASSQSPQSAIKDISEIRIRDPFILTDEANGCYWMYASSAVQMADNKTVGGVVVWKSKDLKRWEGPQRVFQVPENNWITGNVWAPEVHFYQGMYYLFATLNSDIAWKAPREGWPKYLFRGVQVFHSDKPEGPFLPFSLKPHTPQDFMALDGTLWVEDGQPYMIYCHEWVQTVDGKMNLMPLKEDLSEAVGGSVRLFYASSAPWGKHDAESYVTDGCFLYRTKTNKLLMIWSSFTPEGEYAIGIAESSTGKVAGPWRQQEKPLFTRDGGHGMLFRTLEGRLCLVLHQPNSGGRERAHIFEIEDAGNTLIIKKEITEVKK